MTLSVDKKFHFLQKNEKNLILLIKFFCKKTFFIYFRLNLLQKGCMTHNIFKKNPKAHLDKSLNYYYISAIGYRLSAIGGQRSAFIFSCHSEQSEESLIKFKILRYFTSFSMTIREYNSGKLFNAFNIILLTTEH